MNKSRNKNQYLYLPTFLKNIEIESICWFSSKKKGTYGDNFEFLHL